MEKRRKPERAQDGVAKFQQAEILIRCLPPTPKDFRPTPSRNLFSPPPNFVIHTRSNKTLRLPRLPDFSSLLHLVRDFRGLSHHFLRPRFQPLHLLVMSGQYPYHQQQYGHPDPSSYNPVGANVLPGLGNAGGNMHGMNMTGIVSTGSPLSQAPTLVPMSTPSPGNHSTTSQSTMGAHSNHGNNQSQVPPHHNATGGYQRPMPDPPSNHGWPYWIPAEGISRQVINENVCKSLGNDALVRQRPGVGEFEVCQELSQRFYFGRGYHEY